jgi:hypothetical protein
MKETEGSWEFFAPFLFKFDFPPTILYPAMGPILSRNDKKNKNSRPLQNEITGKGLAYELRYPLLP